jgi:hypothetical protein
VGSRNNRVKSETPPSETPSSGGVSFAAKESQMLSKFQSRVNDQEANCPAFEELLSLAEPASAVDFRKHFLDIAVTSRARMPYANRWPETLQP